jgi:radical SAM protein with 4Fe4S-binding SPASM domain
MGPVLLYYSGIFKKLSLPKIINYLKLYFGFYYSRWVNEPKQWGLPVFVSIEPTTSCNLRCPQCPSGLREFSRPTGMLEMSAFESFTTQMKDHLHSLTFYFQGEPYLNPDFLEMVSVANAQQLYTITSTNAHYLNTQNARQTVLSKLDKLIISIDGTDQQTYENYRIGGSLQKVIDGTKEILKQKKELKSSTPHVIWQFVVFKSNENQVEAIKALGKKLGVDQVKIKTAQIYDFENGHDFIPQNDKYARYSKNDEGKYSIKNELLNRCWRMWQGCVITWDGKVVPCCFDKDASHQLGDLQKESFSNIWFSDRYNDFRRSVMKNRNEIDICKNCTEGTKVWA